MCSRSSWGGVGLSDTLPDAAADVHYSGADSGSAGADKFEVLQQISSSLQFEALFALLDKCPLRLEDGLDMFFRLDAEGGLEVSVHELLEECTRSLSISHNSQTQTQSLSSQSQPCQDLPGYDTGHPSTGTGMTAPVEVKACSPSSPSLSLELLADPKRVQGALLRLNRRRDGMITLDEWKEFLAELLQKDLHFAIEKAWASGLVYFAHKCTEDLGALLPPSAPLLHPLPPCLPCLPLPPPQSLPRPCDQHKSPPTTQQPPQPPLQPPVTLLTSLNLKPPVQEGSSVGSNNINNDNDHSFHNNNNNNTVTAISTAHRKGGCQREQTDPLPRPLVIQDQEQGEVAKTIGSMVNNNNHSKDIIHLFVPDDIAAMNSGKVENFVHSTNGNSAVRSGIDNSLASEARREVLVTEYTNVVRYGDVRRTSGHSMRGKFSGIVNIDANVSDDSSNSVLMAISEYIAAIKDQLQDMTTRLRGRWAAPARSIHTPASGGGAAAGSAGGISYLRSTRTSTPTRSAIIVTSLTTVAATAAAFITVVVGALYSAVKAAVFYAGNTLREVMSGPWRHLETALHTSFLGNAAWRADFLYYEKNMNPVLGLFFCDPHHPLTFLERLDIEFCVYGWVFFTSALFALTKQTREEEEGEGLEEYKATNANKYIASFLLVSAPSMMLRVVLFYFFLCPCIVVRKKKKRSLLTRYAFPLLEGVGRAVGVATFLCSLCLYGFGLVMTFDLKERCRKTFLLSYTANWLLTNCVTYVVWDFSMYFNPFLCCAPSFPDNSPALHAAAIPAVAGAGGTCNSTAAVQADCKQSQPQQVKRGAMVASSSISSGSSRGCRGLAVLLALVGRFLRWLGLAQWQIERRRARDRLRAKLLCHSGGSDSNSCGIAPAKDGKNNEDVRSTPQRQLSRVLSKPTLSVDVKKLQ